MNSEPAQVLMVYPQPLESFHLKEKKLHPLSIICCWHCRQHFFPLKAIRDDNHKKTGDYVCVHCKPNFPVPPVRNISQIFFTPPETAGNTPIGSEINNGIS